MNININININISYCVMKRLRKWLRKINSREKWSYSLSSIRLYICVVNDQHLKIIVAIVIKISDKKKKSLNVDR